nr:glycosyltransferase family 9 protein [Bacteroidales bacterium]
VPTDTANAMAAGLLHEPGVLNIGVAPFAKHRLKCWPVKYMETLLGMVAEKYNARFWLFGGREELDELALLQSALKNSRVISGECSLDEELAVMCRLDLMIAMDSSNMHMAALAGTKVISIWGGTDRLAGFGAWQQPGDHFVSVPFEELSCRPCTVYGKGECKRGDHACMMWLTPERVFESIDRVLTRF